MWTSFTSAAWARKTARTPWPSSVIAASSSLSAAENISGCPPRPRYLGDVTRAPLLQVRVHHVTDDLRRAGLVDRQEHYVGDLRAKLVEPRPDGRGLSQGIVRVDDVPHAFAHDVRRNLLVLVPKDDYDLGRASLQKAGCLVFDERFASPRQEGLGAAHPGRLSGGRQYCGDVRHLISHHVVAINLSRQRKLSRGARRGQYVIVLWGNRKSHPRLLDGLNWRSNSWLD